jgi:class 3 adenylate cyclase
LRSPVSAFYQENFMSDDAGEISVLFCDICDFDEVIKECQSTVVEIMDEVFRTFDGICKANGIQKIETVGKTYMAAGGLKFIEEKIKGDFGEKHFIIRTIEVAKKMLEFTQRYSYRAGKHLKAKIGIHYGSCIFGVLGYHKPQFSLIGDTINTTSRYDLITKESALQGVLRRSF